MKAVLLAAGRSFRMKPIEDKNFIKFCGQYLIERQILALVGAGFKELCVVGGAHNLTRIGEVIRGIEKRTKKVKISVVEQKELDLGMAGGVASAKKWIGSEPFLLTSSNDVLNEEAYGLVVAAAKRGRSALLAEKMYDYFPGGYLKVTKQGIISSIVEKPGAGNEPSDLVNIVVHYHANPEKLFAALDKVKTTRDDRYEQALQVLFDTGVAYEAVMHDAFWQPVKYPWHVIDLMRYFLPRTGKAVRRGKNVKIAQSAVIHGPVILADGVHIMENAVIQGPAYIGNNSIIATGALVRGSHIGDNCVIGFGSEVARSYLADNVWTHTNYIGDSIIGNNVSFGAGTVTGNLRLDEKEIFSLVRGEKISAQTTKLGLITGDNIRVGINVSFMPGIKIGSDSFIGAGITVAQDIPDASFVTGTHTLSIKPNRTSVVPTRSKK